MLTFSRANAKLARLRDVESLQPYLKRRKVYSLDLLSGWSCPFAQDCMSRAVETNGKRRIQDGPDTLWRCFSASQEAQYKPTYAMRKRNFDQLRHEPDMAGLISRSIPNNAGVIRIHVAGDFFSPAYFRAWLDVARSNPARLFYAYTKSLSYWVKYRDQAENVPNLVLTASRGGRCDAQIESQRLRSVRVILSPGQADGLPVDHDDSHAADPWQRDNDFALLIHGTQPPGSDAGEAVKALKGLGSYNRHSLN